MTETMHRTALGEKILNHWRDHCPGPSLLEQLLVELSPGFFKATEDPFEGG